MAHIGPHKFSFRAEFAEFANQLLAFFLVSPGNNNACAFLREGQRGRTTNTGKPACNQDHFVFHDASFSILKVIFDLY